ncbi:MAG: hypothetical protein IPM57_06565 [Oligoflexia bacterium]|nr:hypothetical protein [Oligoflexia bacterium]
MNYFKFIVVLIFIIFCKSLISKADFTLGLAGSYSTPYTAGLSSTFNFSPRYSVPGAALLFSMPVKNKSHELELGLLYIPRGFSDGYSNVVATYIQFDLIYRFWLGGEKNWALQAGGYYAGGVDIKLDGNKILFSDYGLKSSDFGISAGFVYNIKLNNNSSIVIDNRVSYSVVSTAATSGQDFWYLNITNIIGYRFNFDKEDIKK